MRGNVAPSTNTTSLTALPPAATRRNTSMMDPDTPPKRALFLKQHEPFGQRLGRVSLKQRAGRLFRTAQRLTRLAVKRARTCLEPTIDESRSGGV